MNIDYRNRNAKRVYEALEQLGMATAAEIAKHADMPLKTVRDNLHVLLSGGALHTQRQTIAGKRGRNWFIVYRTKPVTFERTSPAPFKPKQAMKKVAQWPFTKPAKKTAKRTVVRATKPKPRPENRDTRHVVQTAKRLQPHVNPFACVIAQVAY